MVGSDLGMYVEDEEGQLDAVMFLGGAVEFEDDFDEE